MGKKKSSASKKQQSLAAAVEEAEQEVDELKLNDETKLEGAGKTKEDGKKGGQNKSKVEEKTEEEEFEFDYTGGENTTEDNDQNNQGLCMLHISEILNSWQDWKNLNLIVFLNYIFLYLIYKKIFLHKFFFTIICIM